MAKYRVRITRQAAEHLKEIRRYIEQELLSPIAAKHTIQLIKSEIQSLAEMPGRVPLTPEQYWHDQDIHRDGIRNFFIYFWIDEDHKTVQILGVIYAKRDQSRQLEQMDLEE